MTPILKIGTFAMTLFFYSLANATDVEHFKGKPAHSLPEAMANFSEYSQKLSTLLQGELTPEAMHEIHQLTYTLENALGRMDQELDALAETLESIHQASEHANTSEVRESGTSYLATSRELAP